MFKPKKIDLDTQTHEVYEKVLESKNNQIELVATAIPIHILGCHKSQFQDMEAIRKKISDELKFNAKLVKE